MKRLFKTTYRKLFQPSGTENRSHQSLGLPFSSSLSGGLFASTLALTTLVGAVWARPAAAISFTSIDWSQQEWNRVTNLSGGQTTTQTFVSNGVQVEFVVSVDGGTIIELDESDQVEFGLEGGFGREDTNLNIRFAPDNRGDTARLNITFQDPNTGLPIQVEGARFILLDIDRDDGDQWQDEVEITSGSSFELIPATNPPVAFDTQIGGGSGFSTSPQTGLGTYTVSLSGNTATGLYAPDPNPVDPPNLPVPAENEAENESAQGNIIAQFLDPVSTVQIDYRDGSFAPANPVPHSIGLFNVIIFPGIIGTSKEVRAVNGRTVTYAVRVDNLGAEVPLNNVQLTENLDDTFGAGTYTVSNVRSEGASGSQVALTPNTGFNGNGGILAGTDTLQPGQFGVVLFDVAVDGSVGNGPFNNQVDATGVTPSGAVVQDESNDVTDSGNKSPDPDGDGIPNEQSPTPVTLTDVVVNNPAIAVSEQVINTDNNPTSPTFGGTTSRVTYRIRVQNVGDELLDQVQLVNDFTDTFDNNNRGGSGPDTGYEIVAVRQLTGGGRTNNPFNTGYDGGDSGGSDDNILATGGTLDVGGFSEYEIDVDVNTAEDGETLIRPISESTDTPYINFTTATGRGQAPTNPSSRIVRDVSNDGTGFDNLEQALDPPGGPDNGGSVVAPPDDPGNPPAGPTPGTPENTTTPVSLVAVNNPAIAVSEQVIGTPTLNPTTGPEATYGANTARVLYRIRVQNIGDEPLDQVELVNDFTDTFDNNNRGGSGPDTGYEIVTVRQITGGGQTNNPVNEDYDGGDPVNDNPNLGNTPTTGNNVLTTGGSLGVGAFSEYEIEVDIDTTNDGETLIRPISESVDDPYDNFTTATGRGQAATNPSNRLVRDVSNDGTGLGSLEDALDPPGGAELGGSVVAAPGTPGTLPPGPVPDTPENTATPVSLLVNNPAIAVSEQVIGTPTLNPTTGPDPSYGSNTARILYRIRVQNIGTERLDQVRLVNDFTDTFDNDDRGGSGPNTGFEIVSVRQLTGDGRTDNPINDSYDGGDPVDNNGNRGNLDDNILTDNGTLEVGAFSEYEIEVDIDTTDDGETLIRAISESVDNPYLNFTTATGRGQALTAPSNRLVRDVSNDGTGLDSLEPALDPEGGVPNGGSVTAPPGSPGALPEGPEPGSPENTSTPVSLVLINNPAIAVSEQVVGTPTVNPTDGPTASFGGNTARVTYRIRVQNIGDEPLDQVELVNDFTDTFDNNDRGGSGPDTGYEIVAVRQLTGDGRTDNPVNPTYDGGDPVDNNTNRGNTPTTGDNVLTTGGTLDVGAFSEYEIDVDIDLTEDGETLLRPISESIDDPYLNFTTATGRGQAATAPSNRLVRDVSNDGTGLESLEPALNPPGGSPVGGGVVAPPDSPGTLPEGPDSGTEENAPTPLSLVGVNNPAIAVAEQVVGSPVLNPEDGTYGDTTARVTYRIRVENVGAERLDQVQLTNDFTDTFDDGSRGGSGEDNGFEIVAIRQLPAGGNRVNNPLNDDYDGGDTVDDNPNRGNPNDAILIENGVLEVGEFSEYEIDVDINTAGNGETLVRELPGPFFNSTTATGRGQDPTTPSNRLVLDISNDGTGLESLEGVPAPAGVTPIGGGVVAPAEAPGTLPPAPAVNSPANAATPVSIGANLRIVKRITSVTRGGVALFGAETSQFNDQPGDSDDNLLFNNSGGTLPLGIFETPTTLQSGDVVEYTVYFFNVGTDTVENIQLCDPIRVPSILNSGSPELAGATLLPNLGTFGPSPLLAERAPLAPLDAFCEDVLGTSSFPSGSIPESGGGVVVDGSGGNLNLNTNEIGAFRFSIRVP